MSSELEAARKRAREAIQEALLVADPERAIWPIGTEIQRDDDHSAVASAHEATLAYRAALPRLQRAGGRWDEHLGRVTFPDGTSMPVSLAGADRWQGIKYRDADLGVRSVWLPAAYCAELARQLDAIARSADLVTGDGATRTNRR